MRRTGLLSGAVATIAIVAAGCSNSQATSPASSDPPAARATGVGSGGAGASLNDDDEFVRDVAAKSTAEIELSRIALTKTTSPEIRFFAQMMIDEHSAAGEKLKGVAGDRIDWPAPLDDKGRKKSAELGAENGGDFDREYVKAMIEGHQDLAAKLESRLDVQSLADWKTAAAGRAHSDALPDPKTALGDVQVRPNRSDTEMTNKINQWAAEAYPATQKHLDMARGLENATKRRSTD